jgi:hypothetical protein
MTFKYRGKFFIIYQCRIRFYYVLMIITMIVRHFSWYKLSFNHTFYIHMGLVMNNELILFSCFYKNDNEIILDIERRCLTEFLK